MNFCKAFNCFNCFHRSSSTSSLITENFGTPESPEITEQPREEAPAPYLPRYSAFLGPLPSPPSTLKPLEGFGSLDLKTESSIEKKKVAERKGIHFLTATPFTPTVVDFLRDSLKCRMHKNEVGDKDKPLGSGAYGSTFSLVPGPEIWFQPEPPSTEKELALKVTFLEHYPQLSLDWFLKRGVLGIGKPAGRLMSFQNEVNAYLKLGDHDHIVSYYGSFQFWYNEDTGEHQVVPGHEITPTLNLGPGYVLVFGGILMEKCPHTLAGWMKFNGWNFLPEDAQVRMLRQVGGALKHMHANCNVVHADLHANNVGVCFGLDGQLIFKLFDFGKATFLPQEWLDLEHYDDLGPKSASKLPLISAENPEILDIRNVVHYGNPFYREVTQLAFMMTNPLRQPREPWNAERKLDRLLRFLLPDEYNPITIKRIMELLDELYPPTEQP